MKEKGFSIREEFLTLAEGGEYVLYHPVLRFNDSEPYCFIPVANSNSGFLEFEEEAEAVLVAEHLYNSFLKGELDSAVATIDRGRKNK